jgi:glycosyltransferase involved in cell wall biosynthesis
MKILNINRFYYRRGGADAYYFGIKDILEENGHKVIPFSTILDGNFKTPYSRYFVDGYTENTFNSLNAFSKAKLFVNGIYSSEAKRKLKALIKDEKPDIAHIHGIFYQLSLSVLDAIKESNIPIVMSLNDYSILCANGYLYRNRNICELCKGGRHRKIIRHKCYKDAFFPSLMAYLVKKIQDKRKMFNSVSRFIVPQEEMKKLMVSWGLDPERISLLHNPFEAGLYEPNYTSCDYIVFYGRFVRLKGVFTVLKAMKQLKDIKIKMFGFGPDYEEMQRYVSENKLDNVEINTKLRWGKELINIISKAKFVISAPEWYTPNDYVVYESFSLGKPVVASAIGGNNSLVKNGDNGLLFNPADVDSLVGKVKELYTQESLIVQMGKNARGFVENELNYKVFYDKLLTIYKDALEVRVLSKKV